MPISPYKILKEQGWGYPAPTEATLPELFIIESMQENDEDSGFFEGVRIAQILRLAGMKPKYFYVQNAKELELLVPVFRQSNYRFLHLSCHGDKHGFDLTDEGILFDRFAEIFSETLRVRRLFISACEAGQEELIHALHSRSRGIQSVVAPTVAISYDHAAVIWSALYISLLREAPTKVSHSDIRTRMALLVKLFPYSDYSKGERMSFLFANYNSAMDKGPIPVKESWKFENIDHQY